MGDSTIIKAANGFSDTYSLIRATSTLAINNVTISDMTIDANLSTIAIGVKNVRDCTFQNLVLKNAAGSGIFASTNSARIIVSNVRMFYITVYQGIDWTEVTDSIIDNVIIKGGTGAGNQAICISTGCKNVTVSNVEISDTQLGMKVSSAEKLYAVISISMM